MKRQFALIALAVIALGALHGPAIAGDPWFDRYDHNRDGHWDYNEFKKAHNDYWKHHRDERRWNDAELRAEWDRRAGGHPGWVEPGNVRDFHHW